MAKSKKAKPKANARKAKAKAKPVAKVRPKKSAPKKLAPKKSAPKKSANKKSVPKKAAPKKAAAKIPASKHKPADNRTYSGNNNSFLPPPKKKPKLKLTPFLQKQQERLLQLRDGMLDSMMGVAKDSLRSRAEGSEASAFGMHQADAGSDAYDRDFALSLLSQEQDALYEIDQALKRIELGTYGNCEMSGKPIPHARLEAIPFARFTVDCQSQLEKQKKLTRTRQPVTSLFGLTDEEGGETEEEEPATETKE